MIDGFMLVYIIIQRKLAEILDHSIGMEKVKLSVMVLICWLTI